MPWRTGAFRAALAVAVLCAAAAVLLALLPGGGAPPDFGARPTGAPETGPPGTSAAPAAPGSPRTAGDGAPHARPAGPRHDPLQVHLPRVDMTARVQPVGVRGDGTVGIPDAPGTAGWYRFGAAPGQDRGSAVMVGHVDHATGELGAFAALYDVRAGDAVTVDRAGAEPARFRVTARRVVDQDRLPAEVFRRDGPPVLTLVTCAPPYDDERGYRNNLIVTAEPGARTP